MSLIFVENFSVTVTDHWGCKRSDTVNLVFSICTSSEKERSSVFKIFPQPASSEIRIVSEGNEAGIVSLYNMNGKWMQSQFLSDGTSQMDVSWLSPGVYVLTILSDGKIFNFKILKVE